MKNKLAQLIVKYLPARVIYHAAIRFGVHGTTGKYETQEVPALLFVDALKRYGRDHGI